MACLSSSPINNLVCAVSALKPEWWEQWLPVLGLFVSVLSPILAAVWVARDGRKTTMAAVQRQIDADRDERNRENLQRRVSDFVEVVGRQSLIKKDSWQSDILAVNTAATALVIALPWNVRQKVEDFVDSAARDLVDVRGRQLDGVDADSSGLFKWTGRYRTVADMLLTEQPLSMITRIIEWMDSGGVEDIDEMLARKNAAPNADEVKEPS